MFKYRLLVYNFIRLILSSPDEVTKFTTVSASFKHGAAIAQKLSSIRGQRFKRDEQMPERFTECESSVCEINFPGLFAYIS